jgi:hypothetical protein
MNSGAISRSPPIALRDSLRVCSATRMAKRQKDLHAQCTIRGGHEPTAADPTRRWELSQSGIGTILAIAEVHRDRPA